MSDTYNALKHFADMRCRVVSDVPGDINLEGLNLNTEEKEIILTGIPLVRDAIVSIYKSVSDYAAASYLTPGVIQRMEKKGDVMECNREAQKYLNTVFVSLLALFHNAEYDFCNGIITNSKANIAAYRPKMLWQTKIAYKNTYVRHFEDFCRIDYYNNGNPSTWAKCDTVELTFAEPALGFILWYIVKNSPDVTYFYYGDFRLFSESGRKEDMTKYPDSVRIKALGSVKSILYKKIDKFIYDNFKIIGIGENGYQGYGDFSLSKAYEIALDKTEIRLWMGENKLNLEIYFDYQAFEKLPEIIELLSEKARTSFLSKDQCKNCKFACKSKRQAVFDEKIYPSKVFTPCNMGGEGFAIENDDDAKSAIIIFEHILKYTPEGKGKIKWNK